MLDMPVRANLLAEAHLPLDRRTMEIQRFLQTVQADVCQGYPMWFRNSSLYEVAE